MANKIDTLEMLLDAAGILKIDKLGVTCVDPGYPAATLGKEFDIGVFYTPNDHELGGHVQQAPAGTTQLFLRYASPGMFEKIGADEVNKSLGKGVIQIAYRNGVAIMGIPGDVVALDPAGPGFAFGHPGAAPGAQGLAAYTALLKRGTQKVTLMGHPDCGAVANSIGKGYDGANWVSEKNFDGSKYAQKEHDDKQHAFASLKTHTHGVIGITPTLVTPAYVPRVPGIYKALHGGH